MSRSVLAGLLGYLSGLPAAFIVFMLGGFLFQIVFAQLFAWSPALQAIGMFALLAFVAIAFGHIGGLVARSRAPDKRVALWTFSILTIPSLALLTFANFMDIFALAMAAVSAIASIMSFRVSSVADT